MKILITGSAGFIGYHLAAKLSKNKKNKVFGIDNFDNYYSINLKKKRLALLKSFKNFVFKKLIFLMKRNYKIYLKRKSLMSFFI